jgi:hypothetical protein
VALDRIGKGKPQSTFHRLSRRLSLLALINHGRNNGISPSLDTSVLRSRIQNAQQRALPHHTAPLFTTVNKQDEIAVVFLVLPRSSFRSLALHLGCLSSSYGDISWFTSGRHDTGAMTSPIWQNATSLKTTSMGLSRPLSEYRRDSAVEAVLRTCQHQLRCYGKQQMGLVAFAAMIFSDLSLAYTSFRRSQVQVRSSSRQSRSVPCYPPACYHPKFHVGSGPF